MWLGRYEVNGKALFLTDAWLDNSVFWLCEICVFRLDSSGLTRILVVQFVCLYVPQVQVFVRL